MRKIIVGFSLIILLVIGLMGNVSAANATVTLTAKPEEVSKGSKVEISVNLSNVKTTKGAGAFMGTIVYEDKESLKFEKIESQNGWSSAFTYNEDNGKIVINKGSDVTKSETMFKIIFTVTDKAKQNLVVTLKDMTFSEGIEDIEIPDSNIRLTVKGEKPKPENNEETPGGNNNQNTNGTGNSNQEDNIATGKLPQTGVSNLLVTVGGVVITVIAIVLFVRIRMMNFK
ncbi:MAG: LPXTG cell wall anchor domain-containing protein [Clostridia bacterium]|nr:LPXTG cell wall anchor domain-containing protein [Clostridia bacterium]